MEYHGVIINSNDIRMKRSAAFNVLVLPRDYPGVHIHQNINNRGQILINRGDGKSNLRHVRLDGKPRAKFIDRQYSIDNNHYNNTADITAYYTRGAWVLYNTNGTPILLLEREV